MKRLSEKEEELLKIIWDLKKSFAREVREELPEPRPHINTVATTLRRMTDKGFLKVEDFGTVHRFSANITRKEYTNKFVKPMLKGIFGGSLKSMVSFFAEQEEISPGELREIIRMIDKKKK